MTLAAKNLGTPDHKRSFEHGDMNVVTIAGATIVRAVFNPGWRWSTDAKPGAGTDSCQAAHTGYIISGRFAVRMDDGTEGELGPGDAHVVGPGHDAWGGPRRAMRHHRRCPGTAGHDCWHRRTDGAVPPVRH